MCASEFLTGRPGLVHAFTMRGFNVSLKSGPDAAATGDRRRRLCEALGLDFAKLTCAAQVHGAEIVPVDDKMAGSGADGGTPPIPHVDGMVTDRKGVVLLATSADCPIVLVFDPERRALGMAHAGWRGTIAGITGRLVQQMRRCFGCRSEAMLAGVAPCAGRGRYEVQTDVVRVAAARWDDYEHFFEVREGRTFFDLRSANLAQLQAAGVPEEQIDVADVCTIQDDRFCSYRRDGAAGGHAALVAALI